MRRISILCLMLLLLTGLSKAQIIKFQQKSSDVGRLKLTLSNFGTVGRPNVRATPKDLPSMAFPQKGSEHLFESGIWIGAYVNGQNFVSSSAYDNSSGYSTGAPGYEFIALANPQERSKKTSSPNYRSNAVSDQDFIFQFTDSFTIVPGSTLPVGGGFHNPLGALINLETYAWGSSYADYFVICNYQIINNSTNRWDSLWIGQWADLVVRNVNITTQSGTAFFNKGRNGVDRKYKAIYAYLADARPTSAGGADDINYIKTFGAMQFLGIQHKGLFYNPDKPDTFITMGRPVPRVNYNFWNFTASSAEYTKPAISNAQALYDRMRYDTDSSVLLNANGPVNGIPANWLQLITAGPVVTVNPGDTVNYIVAYIAAKNSAFTTQNNYVVATNESLKDMQESFKRCRVTYLGENVYEDGIYRPELDLNGNGKLDQYIVPEAPASPRMRVVPGDDKVEVYWDGQSIESIDPVTRKKDFEGYRLYRTNEGDDLRLSLADERNLIGQWDSAGNNIGYNNGFDAIRLTTPKYFDGDTTPYIFKYETNKVKNGWQYLFVLTAFDKGDDVLGIESLESSFNDNATYVFPGTGPRSIAEKQENVIGVYPNPYRTSAAWDGQSTRTHKIYFYNLPAKCEIAVYTSSGDLVAVMQHDASTYKGEDSKWYEVYSDQTKSVFSGGEHAWDILSSTKTTLTTGVYLFTVKDKSNDRVEVGKFTIIK